MRVLVVDDEPQIRRALKAGLERQGFSVLVAGTGEEGLDLAAEHPPDLVVLDLAMPGTDGFEDCRQFRELSRAPVIVLSVRDREEDKIRALDLGADDYLTKPFSVGELVARIRAVLRRTPSDTEPEAATLVVDELQIDFARRLVTLGGRKSTSPRSNTTCSGSSPGTPAEC
jgi:DNA-binding response OmpR family regulator